MIGKTLKSLCLAAGLAVPALAQTTQGPLPGNVVDAQILSGWQTEDGTYMAGLRLRLAPGWKTYWRAPGDAGIPPQFDWRGSRNLAEVQVHWPRPEIFHQSGMRSIGYADEVVLPIEIRPQSGTAPLSLQGALHLGVCEDICVPVSLSLQADLPGATDASAAIHSALGQLPVSAADAGVGRVTCQVEPIDDGLRLKVKIPMRTIPKGAEAVIEAADPSIWVAEPQLTRQGNTLQAVTEMVPASARPFALDRSGLRITVLSRGNAIDIRGCSGA